MAAVAKDVSKDEEKESSAAVAEDGHGVVENHVLLVAFSAQGHINPMLLLGRRLASYGIHVTLATTEIARERIIKSSSVGETRDSVAGIDLLFFSDGLSLDYDRRSNLDLFMESFRKFGAINLSSLIKDHYRDSRKRLLCIVTNPFVPWAADVAAEHRIPCALHWIQPCTLYAVYYRFFNKLNEFPTLDDLEFVVELPGLPSMSLRDLPTFVLPTSPFGAFSMLFSNVFQSMHKFKWVLGNTFDQLEKDIIDSMNELCPIKPIGPLVPPSLLGQEKELDGAIEMWKSDDSCIAWLDQQIPSSVIYVSFGSMITLPAVQMEAIANALKETKRPFLWVAKPPEFPTPDRSGQLPPSFLEETKDQGKVVTWSPQTRVLSHPSVGCFLTHCGWNSTLEAICSGVPLVAYPQWTDQPTNAKLIEDVFKNGVRINVRDTTTEEVKRCMEEVMGGRRSEEVRRNAEWLKRAAREAAADGGSSDRNMKWFVKEMMMVPKDDQVVEGSDAHGVAKD